VNASSPPKTYLGIRAIFQSWFWRYYDFLWTIMFINLVWIASIVGLGFWGWKVMERFSLEYQKFIIVGIDLTVMGWLSLICAYSVFKIVIERTFDIQDIWRNMRKFWMKGLILFFLWIGMIGLTIFNIYFYFHWAHVSKFVGDALAVLVGWIFLVGLGTITYQWPLLFFQNLSIGKIWYRSFLLFLENNILIMVVLISEVVLSLIFSIALPIWLIAGLAFFFSFHCVLLEKHLLKHKITYNDQELAEVLQILEIEKKRTFRDILKPWESK
jgi:hypothetical protein